MTTYSPSTLVRGPLLPGESSVYLWPDEFRGPLLNHSDGLINYDIWHLLTVEQRARFCTWSLETKLSVDAIVQQGQFMATCYKQPSGHSAVMLEGILPNCKLYGGLLPDGSTHT